jgi:hypothetical protein
VKLTPLLVAPPTVTLAGPETAPAGTLTEIDVPLHDVTVPLAPLKFTVLPPWLVPNPEPAMMTDDPVLPEVGVIDEMLMPEVTVKLTPLLATPATVTTMFPVVAPVGTDATICESLQLTAEAVVPLNLTVFDPCVAPKPAPTTVTEAPIPPFVGATLVIPGPAVTEKV